MIVSDKEEEFQDFGITEELLQYSPTYVILVPSYKYPGRFFLQVRDRFAG